MELKTEMVADHATTATIILPGGTGIRTSVHFDQDDHKWILNVEIGDRETGWDIILSQRELKALD